jgi:hypothetical protein
MRAFLALVFYALLGLGQTIAVAPAVDRSGSGLLNVEYGISEILEGKLRNAGYPVIPSRALESWRLGQGIPVRTPEIWKSAAQALGAELLILPTLESVQAARITLSLGPLVLEAVSAQASLSAVLWDVQKNMEIAKISGSGTGQGQLTPSFRFFWVIPWDVCLGGLRTNKPVYLQGEPVLIGYLDPSPSNDFYVVVESVATPSLSWTSAILTSTSSEPCVQWTWDQMFGPTPADPGTYRVKLYRWTGSTWTLIATRTFTIEPGVPAWGLELTFGTPEFATTAWHQAISNALEDLWNKLLPLLPTPKT